jgi:hypothetical protein
MFAKFVDDDAEKRSGLVDAERGRIPGLGELESVGLAVPATGRLRIIKGQAVWPWPPRCL